MKRTIAATVLAAGLVLGTQAADGSATQPRAIPDNVVVKVAGTPWHGMTVTYAGGAEVVMPPLADALAACADEDLPRVCTATTRAGYVSALNLRRTLYWVVRTA